MDQNVPCSSPEIRETHPVLPPINGPLLQYVMMNPTPIPKLFARRKRGRPVMDKGDRSCENCGVKNTPEWRKGPSGPHTLCNACGIHYLKVTKKSKKDMPILSILRNDGVHTLELPQFMGSNYQGFPSLYYIDQIPPFHPSYLVQPKSGNTIAQSRSPNQYLMNAQNDSPTQLQLFPPITPPFSPTNFFENSSPNTTKLNNLNPNNLVIATYNNINYGGTQTTSPPTLNEPSNFEVTPTQQSSSPLLLQQLTAQYNQPCFQPLQYTYMLHQIIAQRLQSQQAPRGATFMPIRSPSPSANGNVVLSDTPETLRDPAKQAKDAPAAALASNQAIAQVVAPLGDN